MILGDRSRRLDCGPRRIVLLLALAFGIAGPAQAAPASERAVTIFAAASLTDAMRNIAVLWVAQGHPAPTLSFASSSVLAKQVEQGAPADLFISADLKWMDWLATRHLIRNDSRETLLGNSLVLVERSNALKPVTIAPGLDLAGIIGSGGRLAVGDPASVPAGIYARQALTKLGLWDSVSAHLAPAENVRAALLLVERGEVPAGIVYASDVTAAPGLAIAGTFPEDSHDPIVYPAALLQNAGDAGDAGRFLGFLSTEAVTQAFRKAGFLTIGKR
ncbi:MAG: molybdate ABC transporter substrate-binding protein [Janthinobacterium lividum]